MLYSNKGIYYFNYLLYILFFQNLKDISVIYEYLPKS